MRWPWNRCDEPDEPDERTEERADDHGMDEAHQALEDAMSMWPEVREVTAQIRGIRRRNHLAEITREALRGSR